MTRTRPARLQLCALEARDNPSTLPTVQLTNINFVSGPTNFKPVGNTVYFIADDGVHGQQLWRTSGQPGDAVPVEGEFQGFGGGSYGGNNWAVAGSWLYYVTDDNGTITLWRNDSSASPANGLS